MSSDILPFINQLDACETIHDFATTLQQINEQDSTLTSSPLNVSGSWRTIREDFLETLKRSATLFISKNISSYPNRTRSFVLNTQPLTLLPDAVLVHTIGFVGTVRAVVIAQQTSKRFLRLIREFPRQCMSQGRIFFDENSKQGNFNCIMSFKGPNLIHLSQNPYQMANVDKIPPILHKLSVEITNRSWLERFPDDLTPIMSACHEIVFSRYSIQNRLPEFQFTSARSVTLSFGLLRSFSPDQFPCLAKLQLRCCGYAPVNYGESNPEIIGEWLSDKVVSKISLMHFWTDEYDEDKFPFRIMDYNRMSSLETALVGDFRQPSGIVMLPPCVVLQFEDRCTAEFDYTFAAHTVEVVEFSLGTNGFDWRIPNLVNKLLRLQKMVIIMEWNESMKDVMTEVSRGELDFGLCERDKKFRLVVEIRPRCEHASIPEIEKMVGLVQAFFDDVFVFRNVEVGCYRERPDQV